MAEDGIDGFRIVLSTCADQAEAERIARFLVESRLAACVNMLPQVRSIYRWQGNVECSEEVLLVIKTGAAHVESVQSAITQLHSYSLAEFLVLEIAGGSHPYLDWLGANLK